MTAPAPVGRSQRTVDIAIILFALIDIEQVKSIRPTVSDGAARLLVLIDEFPAACRACLVDFACQQIWPDEPGAHQAIDLALAVQARLDVLVGTLA